ncbi:UbiA family prenyltransferase [Candidatus Marithrix sp. Canyon 246]|uniref:UbiA family prenyltransferase n=1 Tax=Candidatus Marithrix sp. Canyon 246 TaxID=1827136 RepID=UPI000849EE57|nr:UbiA family prenyltransferase [Candidatus Marithrix sp. Canyon 246]
MNNKPLCVDLDGTLIATDSLWESILLLFRTWQIFLLPFWLIRGRAYLKYKVAQHVSLNVATLPYYENVLKFLQDEKQKGRVLVLATAAHESIAQAVAKHLNLFDIVIASDLDTNLKGVNKRDALTKRFGVYDYIGDSSADIPIFEAANKSYLVGKDFEIPKKSWTIWLKALRPHQWSKNVLIFLPLLFSHQFTDFSKLVDVLLAFAAFSLAASAGYVLNDLLDLAADRIHKTKKYRPFAAGLIPIPSALVLFGILIVSSLFISLWWLSLTFTMMVVIYLLLTISYSVYLKRKRVIDIFILASFYTHRILAGGIVIMVPISSWLLGFSMFIFLSLAFLKRYIELYNLSDRNKIKHRDYDVCDIEMMSNMGANSGYLAVLVFALYINNDKITSLYTSPEILWFICPILLYWITRIWFLANRNRVLDDPVKFVLTDKISWLVIFSIMILVMLAKLC